MSGWDVSSTPTWGSQDGPDETQSFAAAGDGSRDFGAQDFSRPASNSAAGGFPEAPGGFPGENPGQGGPPPEFYSSDYGQQDEHDVTPGGYPRRTPGRSLQDLPRRDRDGQGRHSSPRPGAYGQDDPFAPDSPSGFGQDPGFGQDSAFGQDNSYGQDSAYGIGWGGSSADQGQAQAQPGGWNGGAPLGDADWDRGAGRPAAPWEERPQQDAGYADLNGAGPGALDYQREAPASQDFGARDFGGQEFGRQGYGQDFPGQEPGGQDYQAQNYPGQDYPGQDYAGRERQAQGYGGQDYGDGRGPREPQDFGRQDGTAAQMDPALQDFFAPQRGGTAGFQDPWADERPGNGPAAPRGRQADDGWGEPGRQQPPRGGTGPRPAPRADDDERGGLGTRGYIAVGAVVAVIIVVAVLVFTRGSGTPSPTAGSTPAATSPASSSQPASTSSAAASAAGGGAAAATAYTLSTPSTADGFPKGSDPNFLTTAKATAGQIAEAVTAGKAGTLKGSPLSAAYQLPVGGQVVTFVGYQGTFTPAKVATVLATLGTDAHSYSPGSHGGILGCANTAATATLTSGAVCVWSSGSTLGVTEFFSATGPESLTTSQDKGAADTIAIRADVEAKS